MTPIDSRQHQASPLKGCSSTVMFAGEDHMKEKTAQERARESARGSSLPPLSVAWARCERENLFGRVLGRI